MNLKNPNIAATEGVCKLTKKFGNFAHAHILPKSLTRLGKKGERRWETNREREMGKRFDSWFDDNLVIHEGERILEAIDTPAIAMLRKHKLVWSSWEGASTLPSSDLIGDPNEVSFRKVQFENSSVIRLFFLSLVWRAAASDRVEMDDVILADDVLEDIRTRVHSEDLGNANDYPVHLHQITTLGEKHNRTPLLERVYSIDENGEQSELELDRVRIYFDGLVGHVFLFKEDPRLMHYSAISPGGLADGGTVICGMPFSKSRSLINLEEIIGEVAANVNSNGRPKKRGKGSNK